MFPGGGMSKFLAGVGTRGWGGASTPPPPHPPSRENPDPGQFFTKIKHWQIKCTKSKNEVLFSFRLHLGQLLKLNFMEMEEISK